MSYAYTIDQTANLLVVKFWGEIPYSEDSSAVLTILNDLRIKPGIKILVDRTDSTLTATAEDVRSHVNLVRQKLASLGEPRVANVVSADLDYGMIRMFESVSEGQIDHQFTVFRMIQEACDWLGVDSSRIKWPCKENEPRR